MALSVALPTLVGWWLDHRWGLTPWLTICGAMLGMTIFFLDVVRLARKPPNGGQRSPDDETPEKR